MIFDKIHVLNVGYITGLIGRMALSNPRELRELADWYRGWAKVGNDADRPSRLGFADYLEKRAAELESAHVAAHLTDQRS